MRLRRMKVCLLGLAGIAVTGILGACQTPREKNSAFSPQSSFSSAVNAFETVWRSPDQWQPNDGIVESSDGSAVTFWDRKAGAPCVYVADLNNLDLSDVFSVTFEYKSERIVDINKRVALKVGLRDSNGTRVAFGPFWVSEHWRKAEFYTALPTWVSKPVDLTRIVAVDLVQNDVKGEPAWDFRISIRNWKMTSRGELSSKPSALWKASSMTSAGSVTVGGKPFFPVGLMTTLGADRHSAFLPLDKGKLPYSEQTLRTWLATIREAGFNSIMSYTMPYYYGGPQASHTEKMAGMSRFLDFAEKADLQVLATAYGYTAGKLPGESEERKKAVKARKLELRQFVETVKEHPAMLGYYVADEPIPGGVSKSDLAMFCSEVKSRDSVHPTIIIYCSDPALGVFGRVADVLSPDFYPVGGKSPYSTISRLTEKLELAHSFQSATARRPCLWATLQIHRADATRRFPSMDEMRAMSFLALTQDVKGLFFFAHAYPDGTRPYSESYPEHWANVSLAMNSLHTAIPAMVNGRTVHGIQVSDERVECIVKETTWKERKALYIIAVNPCRGKAQDEPLKVTFSGERIPRNATIEVLDENESGHVELGTSRHIPLTATKDARAFQDEFSLNAVHVYRIVSR
ncbi:MAG: hypothetical protein K9N51_02095 [Candidatus Pacebacteria bacterium]|nr:hypothetical protein [Candidatus Paceibacterota bacterium]